MSTINTLKLVSSQRSTKVSPIVQRRNKLVKRIHEQLELCDAKQSGRLYTPKKLRTYINRQTGERKTVEVVKRVKEWYWVAPDGLIHLSVKYGSKVLPLNKHGDNAIICTNTEALMETLRALKTAVLDGELDEAILQISEFTKTAFKK